MQDVRVHSSVKGQKLELNEFSISRDGRSRRGRRHGLRPERRLQQPPPPPDVPEAKLHCLALLLAGGSVVLLALPHRELNVCVYCFKELRLLLSLCYFLY